MWHVGWDGCSSLAGFAGSFSSFFRPQCSGPAWIATWFASCRELMYVCRAMILDRHLSNLVPHGASLFDLWMFPPVGHNTSFQDPCRWSKLLPWCSMHWNEPLKRRGRMRMNCPQSSYTQTQHRGDQQWPLRNSCAGELIAKARKTDDLAQTSRTIMAHVQ